MREEGLADAVGLAAGRIDVMMPLLRAWDFDVLITHNRYTLVNRNAEPMLELAAERGIAVMNAAPYAGGALAKGAGYGRYVYQEATEAMLAPVRRVEEVCARHGVPPGAVALQFSMRDPRIVATICGVTQAGAGARRRWTGRPGRSAQEVWDELAGAAVRDRRPGGDAGLQAGVSAPVGAAPSERCAEPSSSVPMPMRRLREFADGSVAEQPRRTSRVSGPERAGRSLGGPMVAAPIDAGAFGHESPGYSWVVRAGNALVTPFGKERGRRPGVIPVVTKVTSEEEYRRCPPPP